jgi:hypothetical protein
MQGKNTRIRKLSNERAICVTRAVHIYKISGDEKIICANTILHIYDMSIERYDCLTRQTHIYNTDLVENFFSQCFPNGTVITDIRYLENFFAQCFPGTVIHNIDRDFRAVDTNFCSAGITTPLADYDIALSKNFCATLKLPPPPGEG